MHELKRGLELTEKLDSWDHQTSAEVAHTCAQELMKLHSSSSTLLSKTLKKIYFISVKTKCDNNYTKLKHAQESRHNTTESSIKEPIRFRMV